MGIRSFRFNFLAFLCGLFALCPVEARQALEGPMACSEFLELLKKQAEQQVPHEIHLHHRPQEKIRLLTLNPEMRQLLEEAPPAQRFRLISQALEEHKSFDIRVRENGAVVAAAIDESRGGYGRALWIRDQARVFEGLVARARLAEARAVALAILKAMSTPEQLERLFGNIRDITRHMGDPFHPDLLKRGHMAVPHIRVAAENFGDVLVPQVGREGLIQEEWNHKQNDALALALLVSMRAFQLDLLSLEDLSTPQRQFLLSLPTYFRHLRFWEMHEGGAWEEWNGVRVSTVALVTKVFEEYSKASRSASIYTRYFNALMIIRKSSELPEDIEKFNEPNFIEADLAWMTRAGYEMIFKNLKDGESPAFDHGEGKRTADAALAHLSWYPLDELQEEHWLMILRHLKSLERDTGYIRYSGDLFMHMLYGFRKEGDHTFIPEDFLLNPQERITRHDLWNLYRGRHESWARRVFGEIHPPEWFHHLVIGKLNLELHQKYGSQEGTERDYLKGFETALLRSWAGITSSTQMANDGGEVPDWVFGENKTPVVFYERTPLGSRIPRVVYVQSKNSQLNWATAEAAILHHAAQEFYLQSNSP